MFEEYGEPSPSRNPKSNLILAGLAAFVLLFAVAVVYLKNSTTSEEQAGLRQKPSTLATYSPPACPVADVEAFAAETQRASIVFSDFTSRVQTTPRIALSPLVGEMQTARRDYETKIAGRPPCAKEAGETMVAAMRAEIDAILAFMRDDESEYSVGVARASGYFEAAGKQLKEIRERAAKDAGR